MKGAEKLQLSEEIEQEIMKMKMGEEKIINGLRITIEKIKQEEAWS